MLNIIVESIIGAMTGLFAAVVAGYVLHLRTIRRNRQLEVLLLERESDLILIKTIDRAICERALVLKLNNGGSRMMVGSSKYITIVSEPPNSLKPFVKPDFQRRLASDEYIRLISRVMVEKTISVNTDDMNPGELKRAYIAAGIHSSCIFFIEESETAIYYGSFSTTQSDVDFLSIDNFVILEAQIAHLRRIYSFAKNNNILQ